jgi:ElaB/YqjD/DUF883 family membrane-anchored ribosome-binding protein
MASDQHSSVEERWNSIRSRVARRWPELSKQDLKSIDGDTRKLIALVHQRCGERLSTIEEEVDRIAEHSEGLMERVTRQAMDAGQAGVDYARDSYTAARSYVQSNVREAPLSTTAIAWVAGAAIGFMLGSSLIRSLPPKNRSWWN